ALLQRQGISSTGYFSKSWNELPVTPDIVITVCGSAAGETCPAYLGNVMRAHWGVEDPAKATGTNAEVDAAFEQAYAVLRKRIEAFLALPSTLYQDKAALQAQLMEIAKIA
ncbi:MAG: arsenate reductase ArsC, partial [Nitrosomonadales bacterium]|nr:arsenate reductase ArsC [Nitrosomonadales bacterium]